MLKIENQVKTWFSIFSCDPSPVDTTEVLIYIDQTFHLVVGVLGCVLCVPLPIRGGCRLQTLLYPFLDGSRVEMQPKHRVWSDAQRVGRPAFTGTLHQPERLLPASE